MPDPFFRCHADNPAEVENGCTLETVVSGPGDVDLLLTYTGIAIIDWVWQGSDSGTLELILESDFDARYDMPVYRDPTQSPDKSVTFPAFLSIASEVNGLNSEGDNSDWSFSVSLESAEVTQVGSKNVLRVRAPIGNDENGILRRIAYQVTVPVKRKQAKWDDPLGGCHLSAYRDFTKTFIESDASSIKNASRIECLADTAFGANRLYIFTGDAIVDFRPTDDDQLRQGTLNIKFLLDLLDPTYLYGGAGSATISSLFNLDTSVATHYDVDCVQITADVIQNSDNSLSNMNVPMLTAAIGIEGAGGHTGLSRVSYQANVHVFVPLLLIAAVDANNPPRFARTATVTSGSQWIYKLQFSHHPTQQDPPVRMSVDQPAVAQVDPAAFQAPVSLTFISLPQTTTAFTHGPNRVAVVSVQFGAFYQTAVLTVTSGVS